MDGRCAIDTRWAGLLNPAPPAPQHRITLPSYPATPASHPGPDTYKNLPSKTLQLLSYALSSSCRYTHVAKVDDDLHMRPQVRLWLASGQAGGRAGWPAGEANVCHAGSHLETHALSVLARCCSS